MRFLLFAVLLLVSRLAVAQAQVEFVPSTPTGTEPTTMTVRLTETPGLRIASYTIERSGFTIVVRAQTFEPAPGDAPTTIPLGVLPAGTYRVFLALDFDIGAPRPPQLVLLQVGASGIPATSPATLALLAALVLTVGLGGCLRPTPA